MIGTVRAMHRAKTSKSPVWGKVLRCTGTCAANMHIHFLREMNTNDPCLILSHLNCHLNMNMELFSNLICKHQFLGDLAI